MEKTILQISFLQTHIPRVAEGGEGGEVRSFLVKPGDEASLPSHSKLFNQYAEYGGESAQSLDRKTQCWR